MVSMYTRILLSHEKELGLVIHDYMDGSKGYYAKWNKERKIVHNFTYMWNLHKWNQRVSIIQKQSYSYRKKPEDTVVGRRKK